jgi:HK97 family phage major capsid protein
MQLSKSAILEISELSTKAEKLSQGTASERSQSTVLMQRITTIRTCGMSSDEVRKAYGEALVESTAAPKINHAEHRKMFDNYLARGFKDELRDWLAGQESIVWTQGAGGGYTVPFDYSDTLRVAMAQTDPVFDDTIVDFEMSDGPQCQPQQVSGFDLSTVSGSIVSEGAQLGGQAIPTVKGATLRSDIAFRANFLASFEGEQDIPGLSQKIVRAISVALARKAGKSVISGRGGTDMTGIVFQLGTPTINNGTPGQIKSTDISNIYFSVDRWYRNQPKCGFMMSDLAYKYLRNATDNQGRPLINMVDDTETLMGKPVYVSPSLINAYSSIGVGSILFGDLSHIVVRSSRPTVQRLVEFSGGIEKGEAIYLGRFRADATLFNPDASGLAAPITLALIS